MSDPEPTQPGDSEPTPPAPPKRDWLRTVARATETVAPLVARQAPKPDDLPTDSRGRWATALAITGILVAVLQFVVQFYDLVTRPLAPLAGVLPYIAAGLLLAGAAAGVYALLRARTRRQRLLSAAVTLVVLLVAGSWGGWLAYEAWRPPAGYRILVSEFQASQATTPIDFGRRIAETLQTQLADAGLPIEIKRTTAIYADAEAARREGARQQAGIVIWGWYDGQGVSPHVEVLSLPGAQGGVQGGAQTGPNIPIVFATANAAGNAAGGGSAPPTALQPVLSKLAPVTSPPLALPSLDLFTQHGAGQMAYVASTVIAMSALANDDLEGALALFDQALASVAGDPAAAQGQEVVYYQRAATNYRLGRYDAARADLERALALQPGYAPAHLLLGVVLANHCTPGRDLDAGLQAARQAVALQSGDAAGHQLLAELLLRSGDAAGALSSAETARSLDPQSVGAHTLLASVYAALGRDADSRAARAAALALAQQAAGAQPSAPAPAPSADALFQLGDAYLALDRYDEALAAYAQAQNSRPQDTRLHLAKGNVYYWQGKPDAAIAEYSAWAQQEPADPSPPLLLGILYNEQGQSETAAAYYAQAAALGPCDVAPYLLLGGTQVLAGDYAAARQSYEQALRVDPQHPDALYVAGAINLMLGEYAAAADQFETLARRQPTLLAAHYYLGAAYAGLGDDAKAQTAYTAAAALGEADGAEPSVYLAYTYEQLGRIDEAIALYVRLLAERESADLHAYLGALYAQKGADALARQEYAAALRLDGGQTLALLMLGNSAFAQGDWAAAVEAYEDYLAQEESAAVHGYAAQAALQLGDLDAAQRHLQEAVRLDPGSGEQAGRLANVANWLNRLDEAEQAASQALRLRPDDPGLYFLQGQVAYKRCDLPAAVVALQQSVAISPTTSLYAGSLGGYLLAQGSGDQAQPYIEQLRAAPAGDYLAHWLAASLLSDPGRLAQEGDAAARAEYGAALAAPGLPAGVAAALHSGLGRLALLAGDNAAAEQAFTAALVQAPAYVDALAALGDLALLAGDAAAADEQYRAAQDALPVYAAAYSYDGAAILGPALSMRLALSARQRGDQAGEQTARQAAAVALQTLQELVPEWPPVAVLAGMQALLDGDSAAAGAAFARAVACDQTLITAQAQVEALAAAASR